MFNFISNSLKNLCNQHQNHNQDFFWNKRTTFFFNILQKVFRHGFFELSFKQKFQTFFAFFLQSFFAALYYWLVENIYGYNKFCPFLLFWGGTTHHQLMIKFHILFYFHSSHITSLLSFFVESKQFLNIFKFRLFSS